MKRSIRNIVNTAVIATAFTAGSSFALGAEYRYTGPLDGYGAQERADIRAGVSFYPPTVARPSGPEISPLASDSDAFGADERAAIAAEAATVGTSPSVAVQNGPVIRPLASDSGIAPSQASLPQTQ